MPSSSSSECEEDLARFASVVVSAEDVAQAAAREAQSRSRSGNAKPAATGRQGVAREACVGADEPPGLDGTSLKLAAMLDARLARDLDLPPSDVAQQPAQEQTHSDDEQDTGSFRLFRAAAGPVRLEAPPQLEPLPAHSQCRKRVRESVPRLNLAHRLSKRQHLAVLASLAVDGHIIQQAAAAKSSGWLRARVAAPPAASEQAGKQVSSSNRHKRTQAGGSIVLQAWQGLQGKPGVPAVVLHGRPFVPHELRIARLLGQAPAGTEFA